MVSIDSAMLVIYAFEAWFFITLILGVLVFLNFSLKECFYILFRKPYYKMLLVKSGNVIGKYLGNLKDNRKWIIDKSLKTAWMIPDEARVIKWKKCFLFFGSLETVQSFDFTMIDDSKKIEQYIKDGFLNVIEEIGFSFPIPTWQKEQKEEGFKKILPKKQGLKVIIRKGQKEQLIEKVGKTYTVTKGQLDIGLLEDFLSSEVEANIMQNPKKKDNSKLIKWLLIGAVVTIIVIMIFTMR